MKRLEDTRTSEDYRKRCKLVHMFLVGGNYKRRQDKNNQYGQTKNFKGIN